MNTTERKRQFGAYLARLRRDARLSQRGLAERLCRVSGVATLTRNEVSRWERGARVPDAWLPALAVALAVPLGTLERAAAYARGEDEGRLPGAFATLAELLPPGDPLEPGDGNSGRRIGASTVAALAGRVHGLRLADDVLAGGDLIDRAFRELSRAVQLHRESSYDEPTGNALLVQIGELSQIAGWIASDAGQHAQAEHAYQLGISAARQAGDGTLVANLAGSLAYQHANTGRELDAVDLAQAALDEAGPSAPPQTRALFFDRVAWAHAKAGRTHAQQAMRALGEAHEALTQEAPDPAPQWAYWVSREELEVMDARVYTELARPLRAVPLLRSVLERYDATHARELALYLSWLAVAYADANEPEAAAETAARMFELSADVASERTSERGRVVLRRLADYDDVPEVRELLAEHPPG
ncbi:XRE family transcriptional regulator [Streptomyces cyaneochromogenes]|uniref:XRE family transcriptional regulator n=1 Tax=Streptomyces cyaneochromogenes TaxID=2496836 RepID=A0A3Q9EP22_9ACTN|nr:helix-turn-helix transcriptional regulator [Streptomyces cyaneochromogenes]AZQ32641.1 XRE family transcriptional regulator [Streptomyces cyaneochromogenes]